jgi:hypothetical protein
MGQHRPETSQYWDVRDMAKIGVGSQEQRERCSRAWEWAGTGIGREAGAVREVFQGMGMRGNRHRTGGRSSAGSVPGHGNARERQSGWGRRSSASDVPGRGNARERQSGWGRRSSASGVPGRGNGREQASDGGQEQVGGIERVAGDADRVHAITAHCFGRSRSACGSLQSISAAASVASRYTLDSRTTTRTTTGRRARRRWFGAVGCAKDGGGGGGENPESLRLGI